MTAPVEVQFRATGVDGVQRSIRLVKTETEGLSHSAVFGLGELARGLGNVEASGRITALSMRELTGSAFRLGAALGPAGGLIGILGTLGYVFYEVFNKAREEIQKTREKFETEMAAMLNAGDVAALKKKAQDIWFGTPSDNFRNHTTLGMLQESERGLLDKLNNSGGLTHAALAKQLDDFRKSSHVVELTKQFNDLRDAIVDASNMPLKFGGLAAMHISAMSDDYKTPQQSLTSVGHGYAYGTGTYKFQPGLIGDITGFGKEKTDKENFSWQRGDISLVPQSQIKKVFETTSAQITNEFNKEVNEPLARLMSDGLANTLGDAIGSGIEAAFQHHSIAAGLKAGGGAILGGLGGIIDDMGAVWIKFGILHTALGKALWNPITAGPAAIAIGLALEVLGHTLGAIAHGSSGGGSSGGALASSVASSASGLSGQGSITIVIPKGGSFLDPSNPDLMADFANVLRKAFGNRAVTIQEIS